MRLRFGRTPFPRPSPLVMVAAIVYLAGSAWMLWYTLTDDPRTLLWLAVVAVAAAIAYASMARRRRRSTAQSARRISVLRALP